MPRASAILLGAGGENIRYLNTELLLDYLLLCNVLRGTLRQPGHCIVAVYLVTVSGVRPPLAECCVVVVVRSYGQQQLSLTRDTARAPLCHHPPQQQQIQHQIQQLQQQQSLPGLCAEAGGWCVTSACPRPPRGQDGCRAVVKVTR